MGLTWGFTSDTRCATLRSIPSTIGVRVNSRSRPTLVKPSPRSVSRTRCVVPIGLRTSFMRITSAMPAIHSRRRRRVGRRLYYLRLRPPAQLGNVLRIAQLQQRLEGCLDQIVRIRGTQALGQYVADPGQFDHCSNPAGRDNSGPLDRRLKHYLARAETAQNLVWNR